MPNFSPASAEEVPATGEGRGAQLPAPTRATAKPGFKDRLQGQASRTGFKNRLQGRAAGAQDAPHFAWRGIRDAVATVEAADVGVLARREPAVRALRAPQPKLEERLVGPNLPVRVPYKPIRCFTKRARPRAR